VADQRADDGLVDVLRASVLEELRRLLAGHRSVAIVDFPFHRNAGDAAIWAGERAALSALGVDARYVADAWLYRPDRLREAHPDGPVLLHGGGNVGDIWPWAQERREQLLRDLPDRDVIQLPQSIHFSSQDAAARFAEVIAKHGRYTLCVRDADSRERGRELGAASVVLMPDMAFGLGPIRRRPRGTTPVLVLARDDREAAGGLSRASLPATVRREDWRLGRWADAGWHVRRDAVRAARLLAGAPALARASRPPLTRTYDGMARVVLEHGLDLLASADVVVSDRLHAHILCLLLGLPHVMLDNTYGKIGAFHRQWTQASATTWWATDPVEAVARGVDLSRVVRSQAEDH